MRGIAWLAVLCALAWHGARAGTPAGDQVDATTLAGKLIMGYQGWFVCPGNVPGLGWWGWSIGADPLVDMLPDMAELSAGERCRTPMRDAAGQPVELFSNTNAATVQRHFAWMRQYGLDGAALQRFGTALLDPKLLRARDVVLGNVRRAAEDHGRVFFLMYDLSGLPIADLPRIARDWARLEHEGLVRSPAYLRHRGHPLLGVWGLGWAGTHLTPDDAGTLLDALARESEPYGGVTLLGGVSPYWQVGGKGAASDPGWAQVWRRLGVISPWSVGRYADDAGADAFRHAVTEPELQAARALGIDYMPVVFPGYSRFNAKRTHRQPGPAVLNLVPRRCGRFYWRQVYDALGAGATMLYGAMFDEVNEGTAMFKLLPEAGQAPAQGAAPGAGFVTLDADGCKLPSDWYLRLAGAATAALRSGVPPSPDLPLKLPPN